MHSAHPYMNVHYSTSLWTIRNRNYFNERIPSDGSGRDCTRVSDFFVLHLLPYGIPQR